VTEITPLCDRYRVARAEGPCYAQEVKTLALLLLFALPLSAAPRELSEPEARREAAAALIEGREPRFRGAAPEDVARFFARARRPEGGLDPAWWRDFAKTLNEQAKGRVFFLELTDSPGAPTIWVREEIFFDHVRVGTVRRRYVFGVGGRPFRLAPGARSSEDFAKF